MNARLLGVIAVTALAVIAASPSAAIAAAGASADGTTQWTTDAAELSHQIGIGSLYYNTDVQFSNTTILTTDQNTDRVRYAVPTGTGGWRNYNSPSLQKVTAPDGSLAPNKSILYETTTSSTASAITVGTASFNYFGALINTTGGGTIAFYDTGSNLLLSLDLASIGTTVASQDTSQGSVTSEYLNVMFTGNAMNSFVITTGSMPSEIRTSNISLYRGTPTDQQYLANRATAGGTTVADVPEPSLMALSVLGLLGMAGFLRGRPKTIV